MLLTTIPTDLLHDIFLMLDDRTTLAAFIATNRLTYEIFKAHPNAILRQVVCNEIGMDIQVLPYALATINSQHGVDTEELMERDIQPQESLVISFTPGKFWRLKNINTTVQRLAKYYSIRFKEGRILRDTLTTVESRRFHIAAHLFFHYRTIWNAFQEYALEMSDSDSQASSDEVEAREDALQDAKTTEACDSFLASLSTDELIWIQEFSNFLLDDIGYTLNLKNDPTYFVRLGFTARNLSLDSWRHVLLSTDVEFFGHWQDAFFNTEVVPPHLQRKELWLADAVSRVLQARGFSKTKDEKILMSKGILILTCQKCGQQPERRLLFNKTNLEEFTTYWNHVCFPGELSFNPIETGRARRRVHGITSSTGEAESRERLVIIREIMAHAESRAASLLESGETSTDGLVVSDDEDEEGKSDHPEAKNAAPAGYMWSPDDALCLSCFSTIFSGLYYAWWLEERQTDRVEAHTFPEEWCWWGNECRTQRRFDHASRREHCCPRTKGVIS